MSHNNTHNGQPIVSEKVTLNLLSHTTPDDEKFEFLRPPTLRGKQFEMALSKISLWTTMQNIHSALNNNVLSILNGSGGVIATVNFPDGHYTLNDINNRIQRALISNGLSPNRYVLDGDSSTGKISVIVQADTIVTFGGPNVGFGDLIGAGTTFANNAGPGALIIDLPDEPKLNYYYSPGNGKAIEINNIYVHCDSVTTRTYANAAESRNITQNTHSIIYKMAIQTTNALQTEEPFNLEYQHMKPFDTLTDITLYLTNENNIKLSGMITKNIIYTLMIREY